MSAGSLLLLGCGDLGSQLGLQLQSRGREVLAVRRNPGKLPPGLPGMALDYCDSEQAQALRGCAGEIVVMTPTPVEYSDRGYRQGYVEAVDNILAAWEGQPAREIIFVSSTRVYGARDGSWVDEQSDPQPADYRGELILQAERKLQASHHRVSVVRFAGIYGRQPVRMLQRLRRGAIRPREPLQYGNRIHRADCVGFLLHLVDERGRGQALEELYIGVDDAPVSLWEVESWVLAQLAVEGVQQVVPGPEGAGKRCRNARLHASGYQLQFPDYRAGYGALLSA